MVNIFDGKLLPYLLVTKPFEMLLWNETIQIHNLKIIFLLFNLSFEQPNILASFGESSKNLIFLTNNILKLFSDKNLFSHFH